MPAMMRRDATLIRTKALPAAAGSTSIDPFDLQHSKNGQPIHRFELEISVPDLTTSQLANAATSKVSIECDDNAAFSSARVIAADVLVLTGAGGAGAAGQTVRFRLPSTCERYVRAKITNSGSADASGAAMTVALQF